MLKKDLFRLAPKLTEMEFAKFIGESSKGFRLFLHVQPGAKKSEVVGPHGDALKIKIKAPPVDGKANEEVVRFLAEALGITRARISIIAGETSRKKTVLVAKS